jgi:FkbH-like protein
VVAIAPHVAMASFVSMRQTNVVDMASAWLQRAEWHPTLLAEVPRRLDLMKLSPRWPLRPFRLRVHRNQAFEFVANVLEPFLAYAGRRAEIAYSDYDDSLAFAGEGSSEVELVWLDYARYRSRLAPAEVVAWLSQRLADLRRGRDAPILLADAPVRAPLDTVLNEELRGIPASVPGVRIVPVSEILAGLGPRAFDARAAAITGMPLSDSACVFVARALGMVWLPSVLAPRLKAIALDLDNTLYAGVLGEDGPEGLAITPAHIELQRKLIALREQGVFLALISRNEVEDVDRLFEVRKDLPLRPEHLSARSISWEDKAGGLREICAALRIGSDALLYVDDNPGEIAAVAAELPGIHVLHAADPELASRALDLYPYLQGYSRGTDDALRIADLAANAQRQEAAQGAASQEEYIRLLEVVLTYSINEPGQRRRMAELSNKTNQFNTALLRLSEAEVARRLEDPECRTICVGLRDRLSDSGIVGIFFFRRERTTLTADEIVISCRALGRGIEHAMVTEAVRLARRDLPAPLVRFRFRPGPRNGPARDFLTEYAGRPPDDDDVTLAWDEAREREILTRFPITVECENRA